MENTFEEADRVLYQQVSGLTQEITDALSAPVPASEVQTKVQGGYTQRFTSDTFVKQRMDSVVGSGELIQKVYFPRLVIPIAAVGAGVVDFLFGFLVLVAMMPFYGARPTMHALWLPLFVLLALAASLGVGLWLAALSARYRDVRHLIPFMTQLWLFATPVAYPSSLVPEAWRPLYGVNPMVGAIDGFRWALLGADTGPGLTITVSAAVTLGILVGGALYFRRMERIFADVV